MFFGPYRKSQPVFPREFSVDFVGPIIAGSSILEIIGVADVEVTLWIFKKVRPEHRSWLQR